MIKEVFAVTDTKDAYRFANIKELDQTAPLLIKSALTYLSKNLENIDSDCDMKYRTKINTPFTQLLPTRVCFTNAGVNTYGAEIHKVRKHAIHAFPLFLFLILLLRLYVKEPFSEM